MGAGAFVEPLVVISLLVGGTLINRERKRAAWELDHFRKRSDDTESGASSPRTDDGLLDPIDSLSSQSSTPGWRTRKICVLGWAKEIRTPDTQQFADRPLSRLLRAFPFLVEVWYWALIYWVYQLARAFTAVTLVQGTVHTARNHALQLIHLEQKLHVFWEPVIQAQFLQYPTLMHWINRIYSFIHIPGTILFLIWLYYLTTTANRAAQTGERVERSPAGPALYQARRRTMAFCNLVAFCVFTAWPCMPPRLLSDPEYNGPAAVEAKSYGFVDTVHGAGGESTVWTQNKFCNQFAAMPSLHFGYSLLIGLTIALVPLASEEQSRSMRIWKLKTKIPTAKRLLCLLFGIAYPMTILIAIIATANHFILDAVAGAIVCGVAWKAESQMINLLPLEDWFLWCLRMHKPDPAADTITFSDDWYEKVAGRPRAIGYLA